MSWSLVFRSVVDGPTLADWDWQRPVVLPLVLQGLARSLGGPAAAAGELAAGRALLERYFEWAPGVDRFAPVQVETRFEVNLPDPVGGDRELAAGPCPMPAAVPPGPAHPTRCR